MILCSGGQFNWRRKYRSRFRAIFWGQFCRGERQAATCQSAIFQFDILGQFSGQFSGKNLCQLNWPPVACEKGDKTCRSAIFQFDIWGQFLDEFSGQNLWQLNWSPVVCEKGDTTSHNFSHLSIGRKSNAIITSPQIELRVCLSVITSFMCVSHAQLHEWTYRPYRLQWHR